MTRKKKVLFVCLGNICRSPSAEAVFRHLLDQRGLSEDFTVDSAGTSAYHAGEPADKRMRKHAAKRGIQLTSISRKFRISDFDQFDHIIAMDHDNMSELKKMARNENDLGKLTMMTDYSKKYNMDHVPDPYFGGEEGFEQVLDLLEDAGQGLVETLTEG